jgi:benzoate-CoA ligase family protein
LDFYAGGFVSDEPSGRRAIPDAYNIVDHFVDRHVREGRGSKAAVLSENRTWTYREVADLVGRVGNGLQKLGVGSGDRVLLLLLDSVEFAACYFGAMKIGAVPVPTNPYLRAQDYAYFLDESQARVVVADVSVEPEIASIIERRPHLLHAIVVGARSGSHIAWQDWVADSSPELDACGGSQRGTFWLWTSGSTGMPKAAVHRYGDWQHCCEHYARGVLGISENDLTFSSSKLFHAYGLGNALMFPFHVGATTMLDSRKPQARSLLEKAHRFRPTLFFSVPTLYAAMLDLTDAPHAYDLSSMRYAVSAAEPLPAEIFKKWKQRFGMEILDGVGSTELLHVYLSSRPGRVRPGSTGQPVDGYELRVVDESGKDVAAGVVGDLIVRGGSTASCYWNREELSAERMRGEWFYTGDRFSADVDGYFWFAGRSDDMFRCCGQWVSPLEVENTLLEHPAVLEVAVAPCEQANGLVIPQAFIVLRHGIARSTDLMNELQQHVKQRISPYKYPRRIEFLEQLPRNAAGKLVRHKLRTAVAGDSV